VNTITLNGRRGMSPSRDPVQPILVNPAQIVAAIPAGQGCVVHMTGGLSLEVVETREDIEALLLVLLE
jgi:hypothetical protein